MRVYDTTKMVNDIANSVDQHKFYYNKRKWDVNAFACQNVWFCHGIFFSNCSLDQIWTWNDSMCNDKILIYSVWWMCTWHQKRENISHQLGFNLAATYDLSNLILHLCIAIIFFFSLLILISTLLLLWLLL